MNDTTAGVSLATRAKRLTSFARARKENEKEGQEQKQVQTALNKLGEELAGLGAVLSIRRKLQDSSIPVSDLPDLTVALRKLQDQIASVGRPTGQFLNARTREVSNARALIEAADQESWRTTTGQQIDQLPMSRLTRLPQPVRNETTRRIANLRKLADARLTIANIMQFGQTYSLVEEDLNSVGDEGYDRVLKPFPGVRLADVTDEELQLIRADASLVDQLYLYVAP